MTSWMMKQKRKVAIVLACILALATPVTALAGTEAAQVIDLMVNDSTSLQGESSDQEFKGYEYSEEIDGVIVKITADEGVFPEGVSAKITKVEDLSTLEDIDEAIQNETVTEQTVDKSYAFDITMLDDKGEEVQPDNTKGSVQVTFALADKLQQNQQINVYHVDSLESEDVEYTDEGIPEYLLEDADIVYDLDKKKPKKVLLEEPEEGEQEPLLVAEELDTELNTESVADGKAVEVTVEAESFSYYVVKLIYSNYSYFMASDSEVGVDYILDELNIDRMAGISTATTTDAAYAEVAQHTYFDGVNSFTKWELRVKKPIDPNANIFLTVTIGTTPYNIRIVTNGIGQTFGWVSQDNGKCWFYILSDGSFASGLTPIDGKTYYFDPESKKMEGGWINYKGSTYHANTTGDSYLMRSCWYQENNESYFFGSDCAMIRNQQYRVPLKKIADDGTSKENTIYEVDIDFDSDGHPDETQLAGYRIAITNDEINESEYWLTESEIVRESTVATTVANYEGIKEGTITYRVDVAQYKNLSNAGVIKVHYTAPEGYTIHNKSYDGFREATISKDHRTITYTLDLNQGSECHESLIDIHDWMLEGWIECVNGNDTKWKKIRILLDAYLEKSTEGCFISDREDDFHVRIPGWTAEMSQINGKYPITVVRDDDGIFHINVSKIKDEVWEMLVNNVDLSDGLNLEYYMDAPASDIVKYYSGGGNDCFADNYRDPISVRDSALASTVLLYSSPSQCARRLPIADIEESSDMTRLVRPHVQEEHMAEYVWYRADDSRYDFKKGEEESKYFEAVRLRINQESTETTVVNLSSRLSENCFTPDTTKAFSSYIKRIKYEEGRYIYYLDKDQVTADKANLSEKCLVTDISFDGADPSNVSIEILDGPSFGYTKNYASKTISFNALAVDGTGNLINHASTSYRATYTISGKTYVRLFTISIALEESNNAYDRSGIHRIPMDRMNPHPSMTNSNNGFEVVKLTDGELATKWTGTRVNIKQLENTVYITPPSEAVIGGKIIGYRTLGSEGGRIYEMTESNAQETKTRLLTQQMISYTTGSVALHYAYAPQSFNVGSKTLFTIGGLGDQVDKCAEAFVEWIYIPNTIQEGTQYTEADLGHYFEYYYETTEDGHSERTLSKDIHDNEGNPIPQLIEAYDGDNNPISGYKLEIKYYPHADGKDKFDYYRIVAKDPNGYEINAPGGYLVKFSYPDGMTMKEAQQSNFELKHYKDTDHKASDCTVENLQLRDDGIYVKLSHFSPFMLTWGEQGGDDSSNQIEFSLEGGSKEPFRVPVQDINCENIQVNTVAITSDNNVFSLSSGHEQNPSEKKIYITGQVALGNKGTLIINGGSNNGGIDVPFECVDGGQNIRFDYGQEKWIYPAANFTENGSDNVSVKRVLDNLGINKDPYSVNRIMDLLGVSGNAPTVTKASFSETQSEIRLSLTKASFSETQSYFRLIENPSCIGASYLRCEKFEQGKSARLDVIKNGTPYVVYMNCVTSSGGEFGYSWNCDQPLKNLISESQSSTKFEYEIDTNALKDCAETTGGSLNMYLRISIPEGKNIDSQWYSDSQKLKFKPNYIGSERVIQYVISLASNSNAYNELMQGGSVCGDIAAVVEGGSEFRKQFEIIPKQGELDYSGVYLSTPSRALHVSIDGWDDALRDSETKKTHGDHAITTEFDAKRGLWDIYVDLTEEEWKKIYERDDISDGLNMRLWLDPPSKEVDDVFLMGTGDYFTDNSSKDIQRTKDTILGSPKLGCNPQKVSVPMTDIAATVLVDGSGHVSIKPEETENDMFWYVWYQNDKQYEFSSEDPYQDGAKCEAVRYVYHQKITKTITFDSEDPIKFDPSLVLAKDSIYKDKFKSTTLSEAIVDKDNRLTYYLSEEKLGTDPSAYANEPIRTKVKFEDAKADSTITIKNVEFGNTIQTTTDEWQIIEMPIVGDDKGTYFFLDEGYLRLSATYTNTQDEPVYREFSLRAAIISNKCYYETIGWHPIDEGRIGYDEDYLTYLDNGGNRKTRGFDLYYVGAGEIGHHWNGSPVVVPMDSKGVITDPNISGALKWFEAIEATPPEEIAGDIVGYKYITRDGERYDAPNESFKALTWSQLSNGEIRSYDTSKRDPIKLEMRIYPKAISVNGHTVFTLYADANDIDMSSWGFVDWIYENDDPNATEGEKSVGYTPQETTAGSGIYIHHWIDYIFFTTHDNHCELSLSPELHQGATPSATGDGSLDVTYYAKADDGTGKEFDYYDIVVMNDGSPVSGPVDFWFDFPEGFDPAAHEITVKHYDVDRTTEKDDVTISVENGKLKVHASSCSPFLLEWDDDVTKHDVTIVSNDADKGSVDKSKVNVEYGTSISASGNKLTVGDTVITATPNEATAQYSYSFKEWSGIPANGKIEGTVEITAVFESSVNKYTVTFENYDGTTIATQSVAYGSAAIAPAEKPTRTGYTFDKWDKDYSCIIESTVVTAEYKINEYNIIWENYDGSILKSDKVEYNNTPEYAGTTPVRAKDAKYTYTFNDWTPAVQSVTQDQRYVAGYNKALNKYSVIWKNYDNSVLETDNGVPYGTTPTFDKSTPSQPDHDGYSFVFAGWDKKVDAIVEDTTYTALYTAIKAEGITASQAAQKTKEEIVNSSSRGATGLEKGIDSGSILYEFKKDNVKEATGYSTTLDVNQKLINIVASADGEIKQLAFEIHPEITISYIDDEKHSISTTQKVENGSIKDAITIKIPVGATTREYADITHTHEDNSSETFKAKIKGIGSNKYVEIVITSFSEFTITFTDGYYEVQDIPEYTYTGSPIEPTVVVKDGEVTVSPTQYTVTYSNNINIGTATAYIKIKATGDVLSKNFIIKSAYSGRSSGGSSGGGGVSSGSSKVTYSKYWVQDATGTWYVKKPSGEIVKNAWFCDDYVGSNGQNVWYLLGADGKMIAAGLVQDATGNFYSLETNHNGYYGSLRYKNGYYNCNGQQVYLEFEQSHNGSFGAIKNADGLAKLKAIYGVTTFGVNNSNCTYSSKF